MNRALEAAPARSRLSAEDYERHTDRLRAALYRLYPGVDEETLEETTQAAWLGLCEYEERHGERVEGEARANLLFVCARNDMIERFRRGARRKTDPLGRGAPLEDPDRFASSERPPEEQVIGALTGAELTALIDDLTDHQKAVFRLYYFEGLERVEVEERLGLSRRGVEKALERGLQKVVKRLLGERHWLWEKGRQAMVVSVLAGTASKRQLAQAKKLAAEDPQLARAFAEIGSATHSIAILVPADAALRAQGSSLVERAGDAASAISTRGGSGDELTAAATQLASSGAGRGAGAAGAALTAKFAALGGAGKAALACLGTGAITAACVVSGIVPGVELGGDEAASAPVERAQPKRAPSLPNPGLIERAPAPKPEPSKPAPRPGDGGGSEPASVSPAVAPSTPPTEQEFGVAAATAPDPAEAPGGAASSSDVQQEFGP